MSDLAFRRAERADLPAIVALLAEDTIPVDREDASLPLDPRYEAAFDEIEGDPNQLLAVATLGGRIVGTLQISVIAGLSFRGLKRGNIESVRIASDLRGGGHGTALMEWAVEQCRQRGCLLVQLTSTNSRHAAHRFYLRHGWKQTHLGFKLDLTETH
ncbi:N-acetyltransferase family protein [Sphingosinithalassobacter sp. LHW66-3]|uniref:GNAT family N-acetyltransferase n=1 Tax=Sphingosinithalassobacter sp. LHW66-3 TaxID=3424718 RepID=UPI003D6ADDBD